MPVIAEGKPVCTVIAVVDGQPDVMADLEAHAAYGLTAFREYPGFLGGALHRSADGRRLVQYLQWETEEQHQACMTDPRWDEDLSARRFKSALDAGFATIDARAFTVVAATDAPAPGSGGPAGEA